MGFNLSLAQQFLNEIKINIVNYNDIAFIIYLCAKKVFNTSSLVFIKKTQNNKYQLLRYSEEITEIDVFDENSLEAFYCVSSKRSCFIDSTKIALDCDISKAINRYFSFGCVKINLMEDVDSFTDVLFEVNEQICVDENAFVEFALKFTYSLKIFMLEAENEKLKAKEKFADVSQKFDVLLQHECKIPITAIIASNENLRQKLLKDGKVKYNHNYKTISEAIDINAYKAMRVVCNLLDCSALRDKKIQPVFRYVAIKRLVDSFFGQIKSKCDQLNIELEYQNKEISLDYYFVDEEKIQRIVLNFISNAIKSVRLLERENPKIVLELYEDENHISISVEDNGIGIDAQMLANIFSEQYYKKEISSSLQSGTGLGLYISNQLAQVINSTITVVSTINEGSKFVLCIPKMQPSSQDQMILNSFQQQYALKVNHYIEMEFASL